LVKKNQQMEQQIVAFAGTTAGSVVIAAGITVVGIPYAIKYLVKAAQNQALPYAAMLGASIGDRVAAHAKETAVALKTKKTEVWHEANPDATTQDLDIPAVSGDPYTAYLKLTGLPASTVLLPFGDKEALSVYELSGEWNYYSTRRINGNHYYVLVPIGINVYIIFHRTEEADEHSLCNVGFEFKNGLCRKEESILMRPHEWPGGIFFGQG